MRRLAIFFDGTWNSPDKAGSVTNVVKLLRAIPAMDGDICQIVFYDKGVGTGNFTDRIVGGASGDGLEENVIDGYRFLGNNYHEGDEIYIFGFSRGAYTARSLAGLIATAGLLKPSHLGAPLSEVIDVCRSDRNFNGKCEAINRLNPDRFSDVTIKCVGVWDTVGSLGIPGDLGRQFYLKAYQFTNVELSASVDVALHAVAIDEKRGEFPPTLWVSPDGKPVREGQIVEQVWFPGVHSNVGGSYPDSGLSDIALMWMAKRVQKHTGLVINFATLDLHCKSSVAGIGYESRSTLYLTSKMYPYQRLINQTVPEGDGIGDWFRAKWRWSDRRNLVPDGLRTINEAVHISALQRWSLAEVLHDVDNEKGKPTAYRPINLKAVLEKRNVPVNVPVVDEEGEEIPEQDVPWP